MSEKPTKALMIALRDFVFRQEIFVEAREFDDGFFFTRRSTARSKGFGPRRHFRVSLRRDRRRVHFYSLTCGSDDAERYQFPIDFPKGRFYGRRRQQSNTNRADASSVGTPLAFRRTRRPVARFSVMSDQSHAFSRNCLARSLMENSSHLSDGTVANGSLNGSAFAHEHLRHTLASPVSTSRRRASGLRVGRCIRAGCARSHRDANARIWLRVW